MGTLLVDQIDHDGRLLRGADTRLTESDKEAILLRYLPGASVGRYAGVRVVRYGDQLILKAQVTHLGYPWPEFKKRIQIRQTWLDAHAQALRDGLTPRFVGIYHYGPVVIFVDFDPATYVRRKANNSAAHVATNDLRQAQLRGEFARSDRNGNRLTSVRADRFARYLTSGEVPTDPHIAVLEKFNAEFLDGETRSALDSIKEMHSAGWPDTFQGEWAGFYLEYRMSSFLQGNSLTDSVQFLKQKRRGGYDYDLAFMRGGDLSHYGDLKASSSSSAESPGNDATTIARCLREFDRFWYVVYEHDTVRSRDRDNLATVEWNEWKRSVGYKRHDPYDPLSYWTRFKASVTFTRMMVLEVNEANFGHVFTDFNQGVQQSGASRAPKVMIKKRNIDNFLIYKSDSDPVSASETE